MNILDQFKDRKDTIKYDIDIMDSERHLIINKLLDNPQNFTRTLYSQKKAWFWGENEYFSPYFNLSNPKFCCLLREITPDDINLPDTCYFSNVNQTDDGFKVQLSKVTYFVKTFPIKKDLFIHYSATAPLTISDKNNALKICNAIEPVQDPNQPFPQVQYQYIGSDAFTNTVLIHYILNITSPKEVVFTYSSSICNGKNTKGVLFQEYLNGRSLNSYLEENQNNINDIFLYNVLERVYQKLNNLWNSARLNHNNFTSKSVALILNEEFIPKGENLNDKNLSIPFDVRLTDFEYAAITVKLTRSAANQFLRLYQRSANASFYFNFASFTPQVIRIGEGDNNRFKLSDSFNITELAKIRHSGLTFYKSFDFYTFVVSLLLNPFIKQIFDSSNFLTSFLHNIFPDETISFILIQINNLNRLKRVKTYEDILKVLKGKELYCHLKSVFEYE